MKVVNVALAAAYSAVLSIQGLDTNGPVGFGVSVAETSADTFELYGTLDSGATDNTNAYHIGDFSGGASNLPRGIADEAKTWPFLLVRRTGGATAGSFFAAGNPAASPAVVSTAAPAVSAYSAVMNLTALGAQWIRIGGSALMVIGDVFDVFLSNDSALASSVGAYYAGRITGGGGTGLTSVLVSGFNYAIIQRVAGGTAGTILAAGVSPSPGGGALSLTVLPVADTAVNGPIGALSAAASVDVYSSFRLVQTTAGVTATLPNPTDTTAGKIVAVINDTTSTQNIVMYGETLNIGSVQVFEWTGVAWVGGQNITQNGNAFAAPVVIGSRDAQTVRMVQNNVAVFSDNGTTTVVGDTTGARAVAIQSGTGGIGLISGTGAIDIGTDAFAKIITIGNGTGATAVNVNVGTGALSLGSNATDHSSTLGSTTGVSATVVQSGTGGLSLQSAGAINAGTDAVAQTITIGNSTGATAVTVDSGTGGVNIATNAIAQTVTVGNSTGATTVTVNSGTGGVNIGTNAIAQTITLGNTTGATGILMNTGSGNVGVGGAANASALLDITSTTKGFGLPNMTAVQRDAIAAPKLGLMVYNTDTNKANLYTGAWEAITSA